MGHPNHRRSDEPIVQSVTGHQLLAHDVAVDVGRLLATDGVVHGGVERLTRRWNLRDTEPLERGLEFAHDKFQAVDEEIFCSGLGSVLYRTPQVVEHREQPFDSVLARVARAVDQLLALAPLEVVKVGGQAEVAILRLSQGAAKLDHLIARRRRVWISYGLLRPAIAFRARPAHCRGAIVRSE